MALFINPEMLYQGWRSDESQGMAGYIRDIQGRGVSVHTPVHARLVRLLCPRMKSTQSGVPFNQNWYELARRCVRIKSPQYRYRI